MIRRHEPYALFQLPYAAIPRDAHVLAKQGPRRRRSKANDDLGPDKGNLLPEVTHTGRAFIRLRHAVARRTAFDDVADVDLAALYADGMNHAG